MAVAAPLSRQAILSCPLCAIVCVRPRMLDLRYSRAGHYMTASRRERRAKYTYMSLLTCKLNSMSYAKRT